VRRVLFVDDDPLVLEGLERLLYAHAGEWDTAFAGSGRAALERLAAEPFDVLVTDMRMPGMDGATLLGRVQESYPRMVRIVLSGHADLEDALRAMPIAHQFLCKPCDGKTLMTVLERTCNLSALIEDDLVRGMVAGIVSLPPRPRIFSDLTLALADEKTSGDRVAEIIEQDVALRSNLIHLVNSAFFSPKQRISTVRSAVSLLGTTMLRHLVLSMEVFHVAKSPVPGVSMDELGRHAVLVGSVAKRVAAAVAGDEAFLAGMLHDAGTIILATHLPEYFTSVLRNMQSTGRAMHTVELELKKVTHAEIGAYLLALWGMPYPVVEAVAHHHTTVRNRGRGLDIATSVQIADMLVCEISGETPEVELDDGFLDSIGVKGDLSRWRTMAAALAAE
jgi:HD-like signal output (HDOD) protein/CheY-like chemotaxis protein